MTNKHYVATLRCDGIKIAEAIGESKEFVAETICHYLSQYIDEAENIDLKIKVKAFKKQIRSEDCEGIKRGNGLLPKA